MNGTMHRLLQQTSFRTEVKLPQGILPVWSGYACAGNFVHPLYIGLRSSGCGSKYVSVKCCALVAENLIENTKTTQNR